VFGSWVFTLSDIFLFLFGGESRCTKTNGGARRVGHRCEDDPALSQLYVHIRDQGTAA
jgi:hypothetical protein